MRALALVCLLAFSLGGFWGSTQYVAAKLGDAPELGPPWVAIADVRVFAPWDWVLWDQSFGTIAPTVFRSASTVTALAALAGTLVAAIIALRR